MSFTTITYNFYCTVSVFILSGYPRSVGVESKTRTYNAHTQRPCTLINLGATCTSYSHAHYQLWYLYIIWRTLFWYWSVYKETTVSHHRSTESASPIDIILLLCVFWVHWRAQWKKTLPQEALRICSCLCLHSVPYRSYLMSRPIRVYIRFQKEGGLEPSWSLKHTCSNFNASLNN